ncbi:MAG: hypothetical protein SAL70_17995 [Scytonema sp. PMC 1070.18]|nr:hypothetical protein [Scytonema sp. PMC 1070.18]
MLNNYLPRRVCKTNLDENPAYMGYPANFHIFYIPFLSVLYLISCGRGVLARERGEAGETPAPQEEEVELISWKSLTMR